MKESRDLEQQTNETVKKLQNQVAYQVEYLLISLFNCPS